MAGRSTGYSKKLAADGTTPRADRPEVPISVEGLSGVEHYRSSVADAGPPTRSRLFAVARAAVILALVSVGQVVIWVWRSADASFSGRSSLAARAVGDGPSQSAAVVGLAAVVLMLALPRAGWSLKSRRAVTLAVGVTCAANIALTVGNLVLIQVHPPGLSFAETVRGALLELFPAWSLSLALLVVLLDTALSGRRLEESVAAEQEAPALKAYLGPE